MSWLGKTIVVIAVIWIIAGTAYFSHQTGLSQFLITLPLAVCFVWAFVVSIASIFFDWRQRRWLSLLPFASCVLSIIIVYAMAQKIRHAIFIRSLPGYEAVAQQMETGKIPVSTNWSSIPQAVPQAHLAYAVYAKKDTNGVLIVEFFTDAGFFSVAHSGYVYSSSGVITSGLWEDQRWSIPREEMPHWFYVSDDNLVL